MAQLYMMTVHCNNDQSEAYEEVITGWQSELIRNISELFVQSESIIHIFSFNNNKYC